MLLRIFLFSLFYVSLEQIIFMEWITFCDASTDDPLDAKSEEKQKDSSFKLIIVVISAYLIMGLVVNYGIPCVKELLVSYGIMEAADLSPVVRQPSTARMMTPEEHRDLVQELLKPPPNTFIEPKVEATDSSSS
jgi:hypothetical protein